jgi:bacterioferritin
MKGDSKVIAGLQAALPLEATLQLQYQADARMLKEMGLKSLGSKASDHGDAARGFLDQLMKRLLFFQESVAYAPDAVEDRSDISSLFAGELALEMAVVTPYEQQIRVATAALDDTTRNLYEHLLKWHQGHVKNIERQMALLDKLGEQGYISAKI